MAEVVHRLEYVLNLQEKTNNTSQTAGKTIFGRMVDKFYFTDSEQNSGIDFESLMPKKRKQLMLRQKFSQRNDALLLQDKLKNGVGSIRLFGAEDIEEATMNFAKNMIIGRGRSGNVYKGILDNRLVAIKMSRIYDEAQKENFINEIVILGRIDHRNLVRLLGCCLETEIPLLVYEFVSNGNLYDHIHNNTSRQGSLSWDSRLRIAHESAGALAYLHSDATVTIIHRNVKSANIFLDEFYTAKVADFGISRSIQLDDDDVTLSEGTLGYLDPEYFNIDQLTDKSDVFSFGVVLAELFTGLEPLNWETEGEREYIARYFVNVERENRLSEIVDRQVLLEASEEQLESAYHLIRKCVDQKGQNRPSMKEVTIELGRIRKLSIRESE